MAGMSAAEPSHSTHRWWACFLAVALAATALSQPRVATATTAPPAVGGRSVQADEPAVAAELAAKLQAALDRVQASYPVPGLQAAVRMPDGATWTGVSGRSEIGATARPTTPATSFVIGSITKTFVAALVVDLAREGRLSLDDPLSRWLPRYPEASHITLRELLSHTSGIYNYFEHPRYEALVFKRPNHRWTVSEILSLTGRRYFAPGEGYHYSNTNFVLLGVVAERVSGRSLASEIRRRYLGPLGMHDTYFQGEEPVPVRGAMGYLSLGGGAYKGLWDGSNFRPNTSAATVAWAAGAMVSTARDLAIWTNALYGGSVLPGPWQTQMLNFGLYGYGLGVRSVIIAGQPAWGHAGSLRGFTAATWYLPLERVTVSVTTNRGRIDPNGIAARLAQVVWNEIDAVPPTADAPSLTVARGSALGADNVPIRVGLTGTDDLSGIRAFDLQQSVNGSDWLDMPLARGTSATTLSIRSGESYSFRVRARDRAGNIGEWAETSGIRATVHDEMSALIRYQGSWGRATAAGAIGGGVTNARTSRSGTAAHLSFVGTGVSLVALQQPAGGRIAISVDGGMAGVLSLTAQKTASRAVFSRSWTLAQPHTLDVSVLRGAGTRVALDAFVVIQQPSAAATPFPRRV